MSKTNDRIKINAKQNAWRKANREKVNRNQQRYRDKNKTKFNNLAKEYMSKRYRSDINFRIKAILRARLYKAIKCNRRSKGDNGIDSNSVIAWLEWLHKNGHAPNFRDKGIHLDHVIPMKAFNLAKPNAIKTANNWRNLFPLNAKENHSKCDKIEPNYIRHVWKLADRFLFEEQA
jgi:hypothetical protein